MCKCSLKLWTWNEHAHFLSPNFRFQALWTCCFWRLYLLFGFLTFPCLKNKHMFHISFTKSVGWWTENRGADSRSCNANNSWNPRNLHTAILTISLFAQNFLQDNVSVTYIIKMAPLHTSLKLKIATVVCLLVHELRIRWLDTLWN